MQVRIFPRLLLLIEQGHAWTLWGKFVVSVSSDTASCWDFIVLVILSSHTTYYIVPSFLLNNMLAAVCTSKCFCYVHLVVVPQCYIYAYFPGNHSVFQHTIRFLYISATDIQSIIIETSKCRDLRRDFVSGDLKSLSLSCWYLQITMLDIQFWAVFSAWAHTLQKRQPVSVLKTISLASVHTP
jgi:hypothetical protein